MSIDRTTQALELLLDAAYQTRKTFEDGAPNPIALEVALGIVEEWLPADMIEYAQSDEGREGVTGYVQGLIDLIDEIDLIEGEGDQ